MLARLLIISMYSLVSLLTHVYMYLSKHFLYERLEVFQLKAMLCYSFQSDWIPFYSAAKFSMPHLLQENNLADMCCPTPISFLQFQLF
jgi:hypothetical protein